MTKMTKKAMFATLISIVENANPAIENANELIEGLKHEIELLDKKSENRKPSKAQQKGEEVKENVLEVLINNGGQMTVKEIWRSSEWFINNDVATQSITAQLRKMVESGEVMNVKDKKTSLYMVNND